MCVSFNDFSNDEGSDSGVDSWDEVCSEESKVFGYDDIDNNLTDKF